MNLMNMQRVQRMVTQGCSVFNSDVISASNICTLAGRQCEVDLWSVSRAAFHCCKVQSIPSAGQASAGSREQGKR